MKMLMWDRVEVKMTRKYKGTRKDRVTTAVASKSYSQLAGLLDEHCSKDGSLYVHPSTLKELSRLGQFQQSTRADGVVRVKDGFVPVFADSEREVGTFSYNHDGVETVRITTNHTTASAHEET